MNKETTLYVCKSCYFVWEDVEPVENETYQEEDLIICCPRCHVEFFNHLDNSPEKELLESENIFK